MTDVSSDPRENKVIIVGSNYGGTGAGGAPIIGKYVYQRHLDNFANDQSLWQFLISHYKWNQIIEAPVESKIKDQILVRNTNAGLAFYEDKLTRIFDKIIMLGLPVDILRKYSGDYGQAENHDFPNLLSALLANSIFQMPVTTPKPPHDADINRFVENTPIPLKRIRVLGHPNPPNMNQPWQDVAKKDSLEGAITISHFLGYLLYFLADYVKSDYARDSLLIENIFPKKFDDLLKGLDNGALSLALQRLAENLQYSLEWLASFNNRDNQRYVDFSMGLGGMHDFKIDHLKINEILDKVEPLFMKAFGHSFKKLFMEQLKGSFAGAGRGRERELSIEVGDRLRIALYGWLK
jgi:hypothetical protein